MTHEDDSRLKLELVAGDDPEVLRRRLARRRLLQRAKRDDARVAKAPDTLRDTAAAIRDGKLDGAPDDTEIAAHQETLRRQVAALKKHGIRNEGDVASLADSIRGLPDGVTVPQDVRAYVADFMLAAAEWYLRGSDRKRPKPIKAELEERARRARVVFWKDGRPEELTHLDLMSHAQVIDLLARHGAEHSRPAAFKAVAKLLGVTASKVKARYYKADPRRKYTRR